MVNCSVGPLLVVAGSVKGGLRKIDFSGGLHAADKKRCRGRTVGLHWADPGPDRSSPALT